MSHNYSREVPILVPEVPEEEQRPVFLLNAALMGMGLRVASFANAVELFDYCLERPEFGHWLYIAARDGVMSVFHFRKHMEAANNLANRSAIFGANLDLAALGEAHSRFDRYFPEVYSSRHAVAHGGELAKNLEAYEQHSFSGTYRGSSIEIEDASNIFLQDVLQDRTYTSTHNNKVVETEISQATTEKLAEVMRVFFTAFKHIPSVVLEPIPEG